MLKPTVLSVRFVGDSGDGMQLIGQQFTLTAATHGYDVHTRPDFPAEIRAPLGSLAGVSGFDVSLSDKDLHATSDDVDVLVALNPAALSVGLSALKEGGLLIVNQDSFTTKDWKKAQVSPIALDALPHQVIEAPITKMTQEALVDCSLSNSQIKKAKNFTVLGMVLWLFDLKLSHCLDFIANKFARQEEVAHANQLALKTGFNYALTVELSKTQFAMNKVSRTPGVYRQITGIDAFALAMATLCHTTKKEMLVAGYPITPASALLHEAAKLKEFGITLFQAEDEIAACCAALGAAFGGNLALTCTSGPGLDLKAEALSLAVMTELPLVVIDVQRAGPSTGLPTKTEQSDLNMAVFGRHGESPLPVLAPKSASDCFDCLIDAFRLAIDYMTPVILLADAHLANSAESWKIPSPDSIEIAPIEYNQHPKPYHRNALNARSWIVPGTPKLMHRIGGLEKQGDEGQVSYDSANHQEMIRLREQKITGITKQYAPLEIEGVRHASTLIIAWGSTHGAIKTAVSQCVAEGYKVAYLHLKNLYPLPTELSQIVKQYDKVLVAELNQGQLKAMLRAQFLIDAKGINQCNGQAFSVAYLLECIKEECVHEPI